MEKFVLVKLFVAFFIAASIKSHPQKKTTKSSKFKVSSKWSQIDYLYDSELERKNDIDKKIFIPGNSIPIDVDVFYKDVHKKIVFISIPRTLKAGVPATLGTVTRFRSEDGSPLIAPYPSWRWHRNPEKCNPQRIVSIFRVKVDECGRLWVLDNGRFRQNLICPPQILAFDLKTHKLVHQYTIPRSQYTNFSIFVTPMVDVGKSCKDTFVYMADSTDFSIIVHDIRKATSWKVKDKTFYPDPAYGTFEILDSSFELMDGILGLALEPRRKGKDRKLFYHTMASVTENWVYTSHLKNASLFPDEFSSPKSFHVYKGERAGQSIAQAIDSRGISYFGITSLLTINCWNTQTEFGLDNIDIIEQNPHLLQFPSGVKVIKDCNGVESLWVLTNRFQKVLRGSVPASETKFRILRGKVRHLVNGTKCEPKKRHITHRKSTSLILKTHKSHFPKDLFY